MPGDIVFRAALAPLALAAVLLAIPGGEARAHDDRSAAHHQYASPLAAAVRAGDLDSVNHFITVHMADVQEKNHLSETMLYVAAYYGRVSVAPALITAGADVSGKNGCFAKCRSETGLTPLHGAARARTSFQQGSAVVASLLIAAGADINATTSYGWTPLHSAAGWGNVPVVSVLIAAGADVNATTGYGTTPLHRAARGGKIPVVPLLITAGADVNAENNDRETPIRHAYKHHARAVIPALIAAGGHWGETCASPAVVNPSGPAPPCACQSPNVGTPDNCAAASVENCGALTPAEFYDSEAGECVPFIRCHASAIRKADNSDCECPPGAFAHGDPAIAACHAGHAPIPHNLFDWLSAIRENNPTLVAHFISGHGRHPDENYALHLAAEGGYYLAAKTLIESGADINLKRYYGSGYGDPPLHLAVRNRRAKLITLLLRRGADADAQSDDDGDTALHLAAQRPDAAENAGLIAFLLDAGADPNVRNDDGWRPLDLAYHGGTPSDLTWQARRGMMAALIAGGATWSDECTSGAIPNENYRPSSGIADCVCPLHISERDSRGRCECPAHSHAQVNGRCLPKDSAQVEAEIVKMEAELLRLRTELVSLNARISAAADMPREAVEEIAEQAGETAQEIKRRRDNFVALARADLAGAPPPPVAMSDTAAECRMLGGEVQIHSATGIRVCSGIDANDTFCLVDSGNAYPCRGLFRHVRTCNDDYNRRALNPFFCGARCGERAARGDECE